MKLRAWPAVLAAGLLCTDLGLARDLTFERRVDAQTRIERVRYAHQTGAARPFDAAVTPAGLEAGVHKYLRQSVMLERFWRTRVTAEMLERELGRMVRETRMPERLRELFAALDDDTFLIQETLAREILVDRLTRNFFAYDRTIHAAPLGEAEATRAALVAGGLDPRAEHPRRTAVTLASRQPRDSRPRSSGIDGLETGPLWLEPEQFDRWLARTPRAPGAIGEIVEEREAYRLSILLDRWAEDGAARAVVATFTFPKLGWEEWSRAREAELDPSAVRAIAGDLDPDVLAPAGLDPCPPYDAWMPLTPGGAPSPRSDHTAVWTGSEMIVWGGTDGTNLTTGGRYDPATDTWSSVSTLDAPSPRRLHSAVWTGSEMIVWGGTDGTSLATGGRYDPATDSWSPVSTIDAPSARTGHTALWTGSRMIVWGSSNGLGTGGRYDPASDTWSPTSTAGAMSGYMTQRAVWTGTEMIAITGASSCIPPPPFYSCSYAGGAKRYDPVTDTWTAISTANAPLGRTLFTAVWLGDRLLVHGGIQCQIQAGCAFFGLWTGGVYDPASDTWTPTSQANAPAGIGGAAVWTGTQAILWPGARAYDPATDEWTFVSMAGAPAGAAAVWTGTQMIVWGGPSSAPSDFGGRYDPGSDTWTPTAVSVGAPSARSNHTAVWTGSHAIVWGGDVGSYVPTDTGARYEPATESWTPTAIVDAPAARWHHTAVWTGDRMIVWGGLGPGYPMAPRYNSGGLYDPILDTWQPTSLLLAPEARYVHRAVWAGGRMVVWGGINTAQLGSGGRYDPSANAWQPVLPFGAPSPRSLFTAVSTGDEMIVWGGLTGGGYNANGGRYDPASNQWKPVSTAGAPAGRAGHVAVWTGNEMLVWGGENSGPTADGGRYDPDLNSWDATSLVGAPPARYEPAGVWTGDRMVVWGGASQRTGGRYDPVLDTWAATSTSGAPMARQDFTAVWADDQMIVWGGGVLNVLDSGGRYWLHPAGADGDGDGSRPCDGDCLDHDPAVHPGAAELCDERDNDCDATIDEGFPTPGLVHGLQFTTVSDLAWSGEPSADRHDVVTGDLAALTASGGEFSSASIACLEDDADLTAIDGSPVPPGSASFYLVRAQGACKSGSYSGGGAGEQPGRDEEIAAAGGACP